MSPTAASTLRLALQHLADTQDGVPPPREPSKRAQEIYRRVTVNCESQKAIAQELGITPSRISKIVSRVRRWIAQGSLPSADPLTRVERRRLELALAKARHEALYARALRDYDHQQANPAQTTTRTESKPVGWAVPTAPTDDANPKSQIPNSKSAPPEPRTPNPEPSVTKVVTTTRPLPPNVRLLNAAQRSAIELDRLASSDNLPDPEPQNQKPSDKAIYAALRNILFDFRRRAEAEGRVPRSTNLDKLLDNVLAAFLGYQLGAGAGFFHLDEAITHYVKTFLLPTVSIHPKDPAPEQLLTNLLATCGADIPVCHKKSGAAFQPAIASPETGAPAPTSHLEPETPASPTAHCQLPTASSPEPRTPGTPWVPPPVTSRQHDNPPSPPNPAPTPSPPTPSATNPKKPKPPVTSYHSHTPTPSHSHSQTSSPTPHSTLRTPSSALQSALALALHPWTRPS